MAEPTVGMPLTRDVVVVDRFSPSSSLPPLTFLISFCFHGFQTHHSFLWKQTLEEET